MQIKRLQHILSKAQDIKSREKNYVCYSINLINPFHFKWIFLDFLNSTARQFNVIRLFFETTQTVYYRR